MRYASSEDGPHAAVAREAHDSLLLVVAPMVPHVAAELWERSHPGEASVHEQPWPSFDPELAKAETVTLVVQVNGKVKDRIEVDPDIDAESAQRVALSSTRVLELLAGTEPQRVIVRPPNLVNVVL
jgi:leucyl-tRNA synthetase